MNTHEAQERAHDLQDRAQEFIHEADVCIRANPMPAVLTAFGLGFALGLATHLLEPRRRDPLHDTLHDIRGLLATGAKRGKRVYADSADAVREAVEHAVEKARDLDTDPVANWWKRIWS